MRKPATQQGVWRVSKGRLFLLPPTRNAFANPHRKAIRLIDHCCWLWPDRAEAHTFTGYESQVYVSARGTTLANSASGLPEYGKRPVSVPLPSNSQPGNVFTFSMNMANPENLQDCQSRDRMEARIGAGSSKGISVVYYSYSWAHYPDILQPHHN